MVPRLLPDLCLVWHINPEQGVAKKQFEWDRSRGSSGDCATKGKGKGKHIVKGKGKGKRKGKGKGKEKCKDEAEKCKDKAKAKAMPKQEVAVWSTG